MGAGLVWLFDDDREPGIIFPHLPRVVRPGAALALDERAALSHLGLVAETSTLGTTVARFLGLLSLGRLRGHPEITLSAAVREGWSSSRAAPDLGRELGRHLATIPAAGDLDGGWAGATPEALVEVQRVGVHARVTLGPYRLSPRYALDADPRELQAFVVTGQVRRSLEEWAGLDEPVEVSIERALALAAAAREPEAVDLFLATRARLAHRLSPFEQMRLLYLQSKEQMQLGHSHESAVNAHMAAKLAVRLRDDAALADALHIEALTLRQRHRLEVARVLDEKALAAVRRLRRDAPGRWEREWEIQRGVASTFAKMVAVDGDDRHRPLVHGLGDSRWRRAVQLLRWYLSTALDRGHAWHVMNAKMSLARLRLQAAHLSADDEREIAAARDIAGSMTHAMRVIWDRTLIEREVATSAGGRRDEALARLLDLRARVRALGYDHQELEIRRFLARLRLAGRG